MAAAVPHAMKLAVPVTVMVNAGTSLTPGPGFGDAAAAGGARGSPEVTANVIGTSSVPAIEPDPATDSSTPSRQAACSSTVAWGATLSRLKRLLIGTGPRAGLPPGTSAASRMRLSAVDLHTRRCRSTADDSGDQ